MLFSSLKLMTLLRGGKIFVKLISIVMFESKNNCILIEIFVKISVATEHKN